MKKSICEDIFSIKKTSTNFELITSFKLPNVYAGALDLTTLELILDNSGIIRNHPKLHAKIYIFDNKKAIITSGNLTNGGLINNFEYGLLLTEKEIVKQITTDFDSLVKNEITRLVKKEHIEESAKILKKIQRAESLKFPRINFESSEQDFEISEEMTSSIESSLTGWKLAVFRCLNTTPNQEFSLKNAYHFESDLKLIYPKNNHIKEKIRQQIQYLRDLGLIEFLSSGNYRKLW